MRSWFARHPISFMALYTVFYLTAFHWLEVNITVPAIWVHCQLDDVIPFCKYAIVPYFAWFAWIPFTLFYLLPVSYTHLDVYKRQLVLYVKQADRDYARYCTGWRPGM